MLLFVTNPASANGNNPGSHPDLLLRHCLVHGNTLDPHVPGGRHNEHCRHRTTHGLDGTFPGTILPDDLLRRKPRYGGAFALAFHRLLRLHQNFF